MELMQKYYADCRKGEVLQNEYGFAAVNRFRPSTQVIEHMYVTHPDFEKGFGQLVKHAHDNALEHGCRYLQYMELLGKPKIHELHARLVGLGFYPVQSADGMILFERRVRD